MDNQDNQLVIRQYPIFAWIFGLAVLGFAAYVYIQTPASWVYSAVGIAIFLLVVLFSNVLTVTADRIARTLTIRHDGLVTHKSREIPVGDIAAIQLESNRSYSSSSHSSSTTYRIVVITKDNQTIPFSASSDSARAPKEAKARQLREFLGVGGEDSSLGGIFKTATGLAQQAFQQKQKSLTGPETEEHITDGIHWKVQSVAFGGAAVTRWFSPDFQCPGGFVYLAQKVARQGSGAGLLGGLSKILYRQTIGMYGFGAEDTPGLESADLLLSQDAGLDQHFGVFASDASTARQVLNAWAITPLVDWGTRYPLKQMQSQGLFGQLVVLFSPRGTYVSCMGTLIPEAVEELTKLGVELVKAK